MKTFLYKFFYTALALSMAVFVYVVNKGITLDVVFGKLGWNSSSVWLKTHIPTVISFVIYLVLMIGFAFLLRWASRMLIPTDMAEGAVKIIEPASDGMMITYFGLFFFALSVTNVQALVITFAILLVCVLISNVYMFNPIFSLILYRFYYVTFESGKKCLLLSHENYGYKDEVKFEKLRKLNEFTYID